MMLLINYASAPEPTNRKEDLCNISVVSPMATMRLIIKLEANEGLSF